MDNIEVLPLAGNVVRPTWSVMIPTYNCAEYLRLTLQSVLLQDRGVDNMEIWVVDDCSGKDDPQAIVDELGRGRVNFFRQKQNVGQLKNFETCLNLAKGKIIHLLHGDDLIHRGFYDKLESPLMADDSIGAAFTHCDMVDESGNVIFQYDRVSSQAGVVNDFVYSITWRQLIQTPSIVVKREVYEKIGGFNKKLSWCEDWEMWIRISCHYKVYYEPAILASYRMHSNSNTADSAKMGRFIDDILKCIKIYQEYIPLDVAAKKTLIRKAKKNYLRYAVVIAYRSKYESKNTGVALHVLFKAFRLTYNLTSFFTVIGSILKVTVGFQYYKLRPLILNGSRNS